MKKNNIEELLSELISINDQKAEVTPSSQTITKPLVSGSADDLKEPNHLDFKVKNKYDEWVWKSPYAMNRYADEWEAWHNQEREKFKEKHGLSDAELNYRGENEIVRD